MVHLSSWQQVADFQPDNPGQMVQEHYTGLPGGYSSFYFNRVQDSSQLVGTLAQAQGSRIGAVLGVLLGVAGIFYLFKRKQNK